MTTSVDIKAFYHKDTGTVSYVVTDVATQKTAIIDAVMDYDAASGTLSEKSLYKIIDYIRLNKLEVVYILDTHPHADHLSAMHGLKQSFPKAKSGIGKGICQVQKTWEKIFNFEQGSITPEKAGFDLLFEDGEHFKLGQQGCHVFATPGHTPSCSTFVIGDNLFVGDTVFMPDSGTARCDFPGGDAVTLYRSIQKILSYPLETHIFVCHDYQPNGRDFLYQTTVAEQKSDNIHVGGGQSEEEFVHLRRARDKTLSFPKLLYPSLQYNIRGGKVNAPENNGTSYFKIPLKQ